MKHDPIDDLIRHILARLHDDTRVNTHRSPISVTVVGQKLILEGEMDNIAEKRAAVDTAKRSLAGQKPWSVIDRLHVHSVDHKGNLELTQAITLALTDEPVFRDYTIIMKVADEIETVRDAGPGNREILTIVDNGSVTLSGQVDSLSHRRLAEVLMWWTNGCEFVDNQLEVVPPEEDTDNEINDAVRIVLEKDPLVHASQLLTGTAGGVVVLNGLVASKEEKRLAILDTWYVPGVTDVVDRIEART
ncbi:MAG: BON domain-containing protein [Gammaproteobacteria bacterium]|jgi:osmotically-inducible protein OsmY